MAFLGGKASGDQREDRQRLKEVRALRHRALKTAVPPLMFAVLDGSIDRLQVALNTMAAMQAGTSKISQIDGKAVVAVLAAGDRGLPDEVRALGFTAEQVRTYAKNVFGPKLFARFVTAAARGTPMAAAVERVRFNKSYEFMRVLAPKEFDEELSRLASAYVTSIGGDLGLYDPALAMLRIVVPLLLYPEQGG